jgi:Fe2+ or Zn2+ uptake regulation protein
MTITDDAICELFASHGLRCTRQRQAIYASLYEGQDHPTAEALHQRVSPKLDGVSLATVYNTLEAFCAAGIVRRLPGDANGSARYDATREPHLHLRCRASGQVQDAPHDVSRLIFDRIPDQLIRKIESELGFEVEDLRIELVGRSRAAL